MLLQRLFSDLQEDPDKLSSFRMDADVVIDNEFKTSQTDTIVRDGLEVECELRIAHVHHDLNGDLRQFALFHFFDFERDQAVVNIACIAFGAGDGNFLTVFEDFGSVAAATTAAIPSSRAIIAA